ncbi:SIMPL domain-containing protein [Marinicella sediminis]|uniref:SIMPL domain-containing protein n=1 Tax=Marinicella sediminis TaxID=1792834 RepID=A0ABV7J8Q7_9GAMM|nr:SIMPL domain-containing protein [Marinicella sediminis]
MMTQRKQHFAVLSLFIFLGLATLGWLLSQAIIQYKQLDRSVTVKGLSEREVPANVVIWPISYSVADNQLPQLYASIENNNQLIAGFLQDNAIDAQAINFAPPAITDKSAQNYGTDNNSAFRFVGNQTVTVYSTEIDTVRQAMTALSELGKQGIVIKGNDYENRTEYLFTGLNDIKPAMIEEATRNAREVAEKFAADSSSTLGKIKLARQGQFSITDRDQNNPHIKKVRVVSTIAYYLSD